MDFSKAKGSKTLKAVAEKSASVGGLVVTQVDIENLVDNPDNEYLFGMKEEDIEHTARGIKDNGFMGAINVYKMESGQYEIYSGHIRRYAAERAGMKKIPCLIEPMPDKETTKRRQLLGANLYGRNRITSSDPILVARQLEYHKRTLEMEDFKGDMREQLAVEFGISGSQVYKYMCLLDLTQDLQDIVSTGTVGYSSIYSTKTLSEEKQQEIAAKIQSVHSEQDAPLTREQVTRIISEEKQQEPIPGQMQVSDYIGEIEEEECEEDNLPSSEEVLQIYREVGEGITNYYELKTLFEDKMRGNEGYRAPDLLGADFSYKGVKISGHDWVPLAAFMKMLSEKITLDKEKKTVNSASVDAGPSVSDLERKVYKLESVLSLAGESIAWSNKTDAIRVLKSLIAMLTDEVTVIKEK